MHRVLVLAAWLWPVVLLGAPWQVGHGSAGAWPVVVYAAGSRICHQKPERSFHVAGVQVPVCARCLGLYVSAPLGALLAWPLRRRLRSVRAGLVLAALPTALTLALEWSGVWDPGNLWRSAAAVPLGAMVAYAIVRTAAGEPRTIG